MTVECISILDYQVHCVLQERLVSWINLVTVTIIFVNSFWHQNNLYRCVTVVKCLYIYNFVKQLLNCIYTYIDLYIFFSFFFSLLCLFLLMCYQIWWNKDLYILSCNSNIAIRTNTSLFCKHSLADIYVWSATVRRLKLTVITGVQLSPWFVIHIRVHAFPHRVFDLVCWC